MITDDAGVNTVTFEYTRKNDQGRLSGTGDFFELEADQVFKAIGQRFDPAVLDSDECPAIENNRIEVDDDRRTSLPGVWAGGDCISGQDLTVVAVQDGKLAAESINKELMSL